MKAINSDMRMMGLGKLPSHRIKLKIKSKLSKEFKRPTITKGMMGIKTGHPHHEKGL